MSCGPGNNVTIKMIKAWNGEFDNSAQIRSPLCFPPVSPLPITVRTTPKRVQNNMAGSRKPPPATQFPPRALINRSLHQRRTPNPPHLWYLGFGGCPGALLHPHLVAFQLPAAASRPGGVLERLSMLAVRNVRNIKTVIFGNHRFSAFPNKDKLTSALFQLCWSHFGYSICFEIQAGHLC